MQILTKRHTDILLQHHHKYDGFYTLRKYKAATNELVQEIGPIKNDITDIGLNRVGTTSAFTAMFVGTGTVPQDPTQTQMSNFLGYTLNMSQMTATTRSPTSPYWVQLATTARFAAGSATGNLTEVGIGWSTSGSPTSVTNRIWSRALIVDALGNPVTLTVLSDEYLDVTYSLRYYPPLDDSTYTFNISGVPYDVTARVAVVNTANVTLGVMNTIYAATAYFGATALGSVTGSITGSSGSAALGRFDATAYSNNSLKHTYTSTTGLPGGNGSGGITAMELGAVLQLGSWLNATGFQYVISPAIPKDNTKILTLNCEQSWGRY